MLMATLPVMAGRTRWIVAPVLIAGIAVAAASTGSVGQAKSTAAPNRPNVVVLMTDDQTVESLRVMPNVQHLLADKGVTFDNSFVSYPLCCPSRATYLTGQYPHNHGVWGNAGANGGYYKLDSTNTLPVWLQRAGYETIHIGKYLNGYGTLDPLEIPPGWSRWYGSVDPSTYLYFGYTLNENRRLVTYDDSAAANYQTDVYGQKAVDLIERVAAGPRPFFLSVAFTAPHYGGPPDPDDPSGQTTPSPAPRHQNAFANEPLPMPPSFNEADVSDKPSAIRKLRLLSPGKISAIRENYQQRLESLLAVDEAVGQIVDELSAVGKLDSTYVIFTSDNGFFHGEHRVPAGKILLYEPSVRVPLIIRGPTIPHGQHRSEFVANVDLAPTIVDVAGTEPERVLDGQSLIPFARDRLLHSGRDILLETRTYAAVRAPNWLYAEYVTGERELYNLARDRDELNNLQRNPGYGLIKADLALRLAQLRACIGSACRRGAELWLHSPAEERRRTQSCRTTTVRIVIGSASARRIGDVAFYLDGRFLERDHRLPFDVFVPRHLVKPGGSLFEAVVTLRDSRHQTLVHRIRGCGL
jgi:N-acetylglucosamine-6-sulfatase